MKTRMATYRHIGCDIPVAARIAQLVGCEVVGSNQERLSVQETSENVVIATIVLRFRNTNQRDQYTSLYKRDTKLDHVLMEKVKYDDAVVELQKQEA